MLQKQALHSGIDAVAKVDEARAAELRLALYRFAHDFETGQIGEAELHQRFGRLQAQAAETISELT